MRARQQTVLQHGSQQAGWRCPPAARHLSTVAPAAGAGARARAPSLTKHARLGVFKSAASLAPGPRSLEKATSMYTSLFAVDLVVGLMEKLLKVGRQYLKPRASTQRVTHAVLTTPAMLSGMGPRNCMRATSLRAWASCSAGRQACRTALPCCMPPPGDCSCTPRAPALQSLAAGQGGEEWVAARLRSLDGLLQSGLYLLQVRGGMAASGLQGKRMVQLHGSKRQCVVRASHSLVMSACWVTRPASV